MHRKERRSNKRWESQNTRRDKNDLIAPTVRPSKGQKAGVKSKPGVYKNAVFQCFLLSSLPPHNIYSAGALSLYKTTYVRTDSHQASNQNTSIESQSDYRSTVHSPGSAVTVAPVQIVHRTNSPCLPPSSLSWLPLHFALIVKASCPFLS